jgi:hypothetical protein
VSLKRTPVTRPSGAELVARIAQETEGLPPTRREPEPLSPPAPQAPPPQPAPAMLPTATEQINFRGSPGMARLLARLAAEQGSIRLVVARLLESAGHEVPPVDLAPPPGRRRL